MEHDPTRTLTDEERADLVCLFGHERPTTLLLHGEGENRILSFYADGTRLETRIPWPEVDESW